LKSIPLTRTDAIINAIVFTMTTLIIPFTARYLPGIATGLHEFLIPGAILLACNMAFQVYLSGRV
jgi:hypothetical protein